jgi:outer membrane protein OmpA-like peptidoglycan-associated protein
MFRDFILVIKRVCLFLLTTSLIFSNFAQANIVGNPTQNFNPTYSGKNFITVHSSETLEKGHLNLGLFFDYAMETLPVYPTFIDRNIGDKLFYSHVGLGYGLTDNWDFGLSIPNIMGQDVSNSQLRGQYADPGLLEIRALSKYRLTKFEEGGGFAIIGSLGFNRTGNLPFVGDSPGPSFNIELALDKKFGKWFWGGNLGYRKMSPGNQIAGFTLFQPLGNAFIFSVAGSYQFNESWSAMGELWAAMPDADLGDVDRDENSYEFLFGGRYNKKLENENNMNFNFGLTREINHGISTPSLRLFAGVNYSFGPLFGSGKSTKDTTSKPLEIKKTNYEIQSEIPEDQEEESNYNEGYRQGYMAGYGMGENAGLGPQRGDALDGGLDFPEGYYAGYLDSSGPFPGDSNRPEWAKCYRIGFQGKVGKGPGAGKGSEHGAKVRPGSECPDGYRTGWNDAPDANEKDDDTNAESFYNPGYREGYKAGYGIGPFAGLGPDHGQTLNGGWEYPEGYYDGYIDASGPFPGDMDRRVYGKAYRTGFQGKLGVGPGKNTNKNYGSTIDSKGDYPVGYEHGWIDAPDANQEITAPVDVNITENENANSGYNSDIQTIVIDTDEDVLANRVPEEEEKLQIQNITFNTNSAVITPTSNKVLANVLKYLNKHEFKSLEIWGHTDARGAALYNEKLSLARAQSVYNYFVNAGIPAAKMKYDGWGERKPVAPNVTDLELRQNRRVEFIIRR